MRNRHREPVLKSREPAGRGLARREDSRLTNLRARPQPSGRGPARGEGVDYVLCHHCGREFRVVGWCHLVRIHGYDPEHPVEEYKKLFGLRRAQCDRTRGRMKASLRAHFERLGRHWSRSRVKGEVLRFSRRGAALSWREVSQQNATLAWAGRRLFGSWERVIRACGIPYDGVRKHRAWTPASLVAAISARESRGAKLNSAAVRREDYGLLQAAVAQWGSWANALRAAGIDPGEHRACRRWTPTNVAQTIRSFGRVPGLRELKRIDSGLLDAACRHYGSYRAAVAAAGLEAPARNAPRKWPLVKVLDEIRRRAASGLSVRATDIQREFRGLGAAGQREFGTWPQAVQAAGVPYPRRAEGWKWPRRRIMEVIQARVARGRDIRNTTMRRQFGGLWWAGCREFGTWRAAVEAAGVKYPALMRSDHGTRSE